MKTSCMHCADPSCVSACPVSAMTKDPVTGIVELQPGQVHRLPLLRRRLPVRHAEVPVRRAARPQIGKCELCSHRHKDGHYSACAEVCPTGATLFGKTADLLAEAKRRLALKPGEVTTYPRGRLGDAAATGVNWRQEPDQSYEGAVGKYLQHVYGEKEYGGTQVLKLSGVPFEKVGMPKLPPDSSAATSETIQHTLYGGLIMPIAVLGALTCVAKRNVKPETTEEGGQVMAAHNIMPTPAARRRAAAQRGHPDRAAMLVADRGGHPGGAASFFGLGASPTSTTATRGASGSSSM